ncbi:3'-5' exoribonuclease YhaM [Botrimarina colliarenosi]|uniref:3'-5' exoribonuclease YhaM n=1 Tax=Botrimarina colliarenosi TaxID=2528001 RepID=A0A5C6AGE9_9BACT|nr:HD domain-containing protein [Botrimarina colliarenosi]TWT99112.1 3'-5' exoribonuclease YhaM [Botrimarina colliarenosi]
MSRLFVSQLQHNQQVDQVFLASNKQLRPNRQGNLFLQIDLSDRSGSMPCRMWNASEREYSSFENGDYLYIEGMAQLFQGSMQLIAQSIKKAEAGEVDESDFMTLQTAEVQELRERLTKTLRGVKQKALAALVEAYLGDDVFMDKFCRAPAGIKNHHAYKGGLLDHVVNMLDLVQVVAPKYPAVDLEKLLVGTFLHDSGKVDELEYERDLAYTDEGQMLGHIVQAVCVLDAKAREAEQRSQIAFPPVLLMELKHMVLSHHGRYEFGSPKVPMTLEAVVLAALDDMDAKLASFAGLIKECPNSDSRWTQYFPNIDRKLWKGVKGE